MVWTPNQLLARWPIRDKLLIGLGLLIVIVSTLSWTGFHGLYAYRRLVKGLGRRVDELPVASQLVQRVTDLRITLRGPAALGELNFASSETRLVDVHLVREDFRAGLEALRKAIDSYRDQLESNHNLQSPIHDDVHEWQVVRELETILQGVSEVDLDEDWVWNRIERREIDDALEQMQARAGQLPRFLQQQIEQFSEEARLQYRTLIILSWISTVSAVLLLVIFVRLFYGWVFRPLRVLIKGSRKVAGGHFEYRIQLDSQDEMAELADAMNAMTAQFRAIRDDLDRQVQERTKQVVRSEQLASVGFLAAGVAHEINNPLASIALCAESLEGRMRDLLDAGHPQHEVIARYLSMIQEEAFRCKEITEKLLDFSRMGDLRRHATPLRELVLGVIEMVRHLGKYQDKSVELADGPELMVDVNPQEIKQVVLNLIANGLDALESGGCVRIALDERDGQAEIVFDDDGCGMSAETLEHLFEPFFTRRRGGQGTGLGLSISYRIVADHGGQIEAASAGPGRGSRFAVRLPIVRSQKEQSHFHQAA